LLLVLSLASLTWCSRFSSSFNANRARPLSSSNRTLRKAGSSPTLATFWRRARLALAGSAKDLLANPDVGRLFLGGYRGLPTSSNALASAGYPSQANARGQRLRWQPDRLQVHPAPMRSIGPRYRRPPMRAAARASWGRQRCQRALVFCRIL